MWGTTEGSGLPVCQVTCVGLLAFSGCFWPPNKNSVEGVLSEYYCVLKMQKPKHKSVCDFSQAHTGK